MRPKVLRLFRGEAFGRKLAGVAPLAASGVVAEMGGGGAEKEEEEEEELYLRSK